jgi:DNA-directed RNA polymerase specialized sigma subunit
MIETGEVNNQSELAEKLGISRARVYQVPAILKLDEKLMSAIEQL